jgi:hypothetical protein
MDNQTTLNLTLLFAERDLFVGKQEDNHICSMTTINNIALTFESYIVFKK